MEQELARVLDPEELREARGPVARLAVDVPDAWRREEAEIAIVVPRRLVCARCDGGGCDTCSRSGAFRLELDEESRTLSLTLSSSEPDKNIGVRLVRPFDERADIEQLWIEIRSSVEASAFCSLRPRPSAPPQHALSGTIWIAVLVAAALLLAVLLARQ